MKTKMLIVQIALLFFFNITNAVAKEVKPGETSNNEAEKPASFWDNLSGSATIMSNSIFRGLSQTENLPAFQSGLNYAFPLGFYLALLGSNVKFTDTDATVEGDISIGFQKEINEDFNFDVSAVRYTYPSASTLNYNELIGVINWKFFQVNLGYSGNAYNVHKSGTYTNGGINYTIPSKNILLENVTLLALFGHYNLPKEAGNSYNDYLISLTKTIKIYDFSLQWTDTNHRNPPYDKSYVAAVITANF